MPEYSTVQCTETSIQTSKPNKYNTMITNKAQVIQVIKSHPGEFAEVKNPSYVHPSVEFYPLADRIKRLQSLKAVFMDMDGTTTTTEVLCIHSLESMLRKMSGKHSREAWPGLDHRDDLAHIIGNSTTKHVEYLLIKYGHMLDHAQLVRSFFAAAQHTLCHGVDAQRKREVIENLHKLKLGSAIADIEKGADTDRLLNTCGSLAGPNDFATRVGMGIDIYYDCYHRILSLLKEGKTDTVQRQVFGDSAPGQDLISPMPGIAVLIPLVKGWLGSDAGLLADRLCDDYTKSTGKGMQGRDRDACAKKISGMGAAFEKQPLKLGLVTSSIRYEADIVVREVLQVMGRVIEESPLDRAKKRRILQAYQDYNRVYDAFVTATDSSEIRLKPHRDLYSIALHKAGIMPCDFDKVAGFEDSQSGTIAIRAAGIGCCIAVPFAQTSGHNLDAAAHVLTGGIPQAIIDYNLFAE